MCGERNRVKMGFFDSFNMMSDKPAFLAKAATPADRKAAFIKKYPDYKNWPHWDDYGYPMPDPKELEHFIPAPEIDADLNSPDEDDDEV